MEPDNAASLLLFLSMVIFMGVFSSVKAMLPDIVPFLQTGSWQIQTGLFTPARALGLHGRAASAAADASD